MKCRLDLFLDMCKGAKVVELGVWYGDFMHEICRNRPDLDYTGIDTWRGRFESGYNIAQCKCPKNFKLLRGDTADMAKTIDHESLDLVYIDALHTKEAVTKDINAWWPKVKPGAILAGHDYESKPAMDGWEPIEVKEAVDQWAKEQGLTVNVIDEGAPSWWVVKPWY